MDSDYEDMREPRDPSVRRLVVVSNRLPVVLSDKGGNWITEPGSGGLVTALAPVLRDRGGVWIGWPGAAMRPGMDELIRAAAADPGYSLVPVPLDDDEVSYYYKGFSNEVIWPLFHDLQTRCNFDPDYWDYYREVNRKFAHVTAENTDDDDFIWVHDYHLMLMAEELRKLGRKAKLGFFLHIPFPSLDIFVKLPWRSQLLRALLSFDLVGFQTLRDRRNFTQCLRALVDQVSTRGGRGQVCEIDAEAATVRAGAFPISIDFRQFEAEAGSKEVAETAWQIHENLPERQIILGVDRMDYTKGIPERLKAFRRFLELYPEHRDRVTLVQVVVPSRRGIPEYEDLKTEIERLVGEINGQFTGRSAWVPIHYIYGSLERRDLLGYYRSSEIALLTPYKDGMNLVAKEYCACSLEENCVLVLSEFAGAAAELQGGALLVNPYDIVGMAEAIHEAVEMPPAERHRRMHRLRRTLRRHDIFWWVDSFLRASIEKDLGSFPVVADYVHESTVKK
jgi:trehalose 6-phosphate synthase/phosphatase